MNTIKYRVKELDSGLYDDEYFIYPSGTINHPTKHVEPRNLKVELFSGMNDSKGEPLYEGDRVIYSMYHCELVREDYKWSIISDETVGFKARGMCPLSRNMKIFKTI